jgi:hypothetical protein
MTTPAMDNAPPRMATSAGTSPRMSHARTIAVGGIKYIVVARRPAVDRLNANAQVVNATEVGKTPR